MSKANTAPRIQLASFEEMLGGGQTPQTAAQPLTLPIAELKPFPDHKYELYTGEKLAAMVESIKEHGVLQPVIVWNRNGEHIILSGHNRTNAAQIAGLESVPVVIKDNLAEDEARFIVSETNLKQRSIADLSHSQRAVALTEHYNAVKAQGKKKALIDEIDALLQNGVPVGNERSIEKTCRDFGLSQGSVARYLRIGTLTPALWPDIDSGKISIRAAVDLSWIQQAHQKIVAELAEGGCKVEMSKAQCLRQQADILTTDKIKEILQDNPQKSASRQVAISQTLYARYFEQKKKNEVAAILEKALAQYFATNN